MRFRAGEFVQPQQVGAECPLAVGGVYRVSKVDGDGSLHFDRCGSGGHDPKAHGFIRVPAPAVQRFTQGVRVQVARDASIADHECTLSRGRTHRIDEVDDFNRLRFFHQGCEHCHDPRHFSAVKA